MFVESFTQHANLTWKLSYWLVGNNSTGDCQGTLHSNWSSSLKENSTDLEKQSVMGEFKTNLKVRNCFELIQDFFFYKLIKKNF